MAKNVLAVFMQGYAEKVFDKMDIWCFHSLLIGGNDEHGFSIWTFLAEGCLSSCGSRSIVPLKPVLVREAWLPFIAGLGTSSSEMEVIVKTSSGPFDSFGFHLLVKDLTKVGHK